ncbi:hypothetical protein [Mycobacterium avium]|uniref:hypothetical protein n=1 Tax=Mycobacterium avium TaxID=1764 RepID=UPI00293BB0E7|nr:hypothetical protein [Mycobacterium avium]
MAGAKRVLRRLSDAADFLVCCPVECVEVFPLPAVQLAYLFRRAGRREPPLIRLIREPGRLPVQALVISVDRSTRLFARHPISFALKGFRRRYQRSSFGVLRLSKTLPVLGIGEWP